MADITMCSGLGCDMKHDCYRLPQKGHTGNRGLLMYLSKMVSVKCSGITN